MISLNAKQANITFDQPLEMLHACHGKILQQCDTLEKLAAHLPHHGCDDQAQQAARRILRYFETAGQFHHLDEENDLFPALRLSAGKESQHDELLGKLLTEHAGMLAAWYAVREVLHALDNGINAPLPNELVENFTRRYRAHIDLEERELLPWAAQLLTPVQQQHIGNQMAARRVIS
jgi:hemerythrin-like domain-containing protein